MRGICAFLFTLLLAAPAFAMLPAEQPYRIGFNGRIATDVYIDGKGPYNFLIDTASSRSLMFEHVRKELNLGQSQPQFLKIYGINDVGEAMPVKPKTLQVAGESVPGMVMGVLPDQGKGPDGVLGTDFLSRYFVVLDRGAMRFRLLEPGSGSSRAFDDWTAATLTSRPFKNFDIRFWYLDTRFNDKKLSALFDLGAAMTMLNWQAAEKLGVHQSRFAANGPPPEILQDILGKSAPAVQLFGLDVRMYSRQWNQQNAIVADAPVFDYFDLEEKPAAIVGLGLLGNNSLAIDFQGGKLFVGPMAKEEEKGG